MGKLRIRVGDVTATLSRDLGADARRAWDLSSNRAVQSMEAERDRVFDNARSRWPVKTGRSRAGLNDYTQVELGGRNNGRIKVGIDNDVGYTRWVRLPGGSPFAVTALLRTPMRRASRRLLERLGPELRDQLNKALPTGKR